MATTAALRARLHELVDELPDAELAAARRFLEFLGLTEDPVLRALRLTPPDDEPVTDEERAAIAEARAEYERGEAIPWDRLRDELSRRTGT